MSSKINLLETAEINKNKAGVHFPNVQCAKFTSHPHYTLLSCSLFCRDPKRGLDLDEIRPSKAKTRPNTKKSLFVLYSLIWSHKVCYSLVLTPIVCKVSHADPFNLGSFGHFLDQYF